MATAHRPGDDVPSAVLRCGSSGIGKYGREEYSFPAAGGRKQSGQESVESGQKSPRRKRGRNGLQVRRISRAVAQPGCGLAVEDRRRNRRAQIQSGSGEQSWGDRGFDKNLAADALAGIGFLISMMVVIAIMVVMGGFLPHQQRQGAMVRAGGVPHRQEEQTEKGNRNGPASHIALSLCKAFLFVQAPSCGDR